MGRNWSGTRDLAFKSHNSKGEEESRKVLPQGILCQLPQMSSLYLSSDSLCLASTLVSVFLSDFISLFFYLPFTVHPFLVHLCSFVAFTFSLLLPSFHYSSNYKYSCVSVPMVSVSLVILLFFLQSTSYIQLFEHRSFFLSDFLYSIER